MVNTKAIGFVILIGSVCVLVSYVLGIVYDTILTLQVTALTAVLAVLGILTWVGYTMLTEPPPVQASDPSELDDLTPETISPDTGNHVALRKTPRFSVIVDAEIGEGTVVRDHVNLYKCRIGKNCKIESFVYIEEGVVIGDNCKIKPHVYIPTGVTVEDNVFLGPDVTFTNDKYPHSRGDWRLLKTVVMQGATIGAQSVILPGVIIGKDAMIGAGCVVTHDVPDGETVCGNPARPVVKP